MNHSNGNSIVNAAHHNGHHHDQMVKSSSDTFVVENTPQKKVLVLYTGGTIGMFRNQCGGKEHYFWIKMFPREINWCNYFSPHTKSELFRQ